MGIVAMKTMAGGITRVGRGDRLYGADPKAPFKQLSQAGAPLAAISWALKNESLDTAIVCMTDHDQLLENLHAMSEPYTPDRTTSCWPSSWPISARPIAGCAGRATASATRACRSRTCCAS